MYISLTRFTGHLIKIFGFKRTNGAFMEIIMRLCVNQRLSCSFHVADPGLIKCLDAIVAIYTH